MLNKKQLSTLRHINILEYAEYEENGKPIDFINEEFFIPTLVEFKNFVFDLIKRKGFLTIERTEPCRANCIIRIFEKQHYRYDDKYTINAYGVCCFTKKNDKWITHCAYDPETEIIFSNHFIKIDLYQDEPVFIPTDFFDIYVKIS